MKEFKKELCCLASEYAHGMIPEIEFKLEFSNCIVKHIKKITPAQIYHLINEIMDSKKFD